MKKCIFTGVATALVTPFNQDLSINFGMFKELIEFQIKEGVDALVVCGTTGESATLSEKEKIGLFKSAVSFSKGRLPIIAGTGTNSTAKSIELCKMAEDSGVDGLLIVTPYYNKTSQSGLIKHYYALAEATSLPIIVYNVPSRTGLDIRPETYKALLEHPNIVAIKEACTNISTLTETFSICDDPCIYSGNDDLTLPILSLGGKGVISVVSNLFPRKVSDLCKAYFKGDTKTAAKIQISLMPIIKAVFSDVNPMPIKVAMKLSGLDVGPTRPPLYEISEDLQEKLKNLIK